MTLTIFGSCRQDSLYKIFNVTDIKNRLTYPHYSAEVLQAVRYCSGIADPSLLSSDFVFRSWILDRKRFPYRKILRQFIKTDLFVLEIATRCSYKYKDSYLHHICVDEEYGFPDIDNVQFYLEDDNVVKSNIAEIQRILGPKPFMVVSHFYTRELGPRFDFVCSLKSICAELNIPFFDPVEQLGGVKNLLPLVEDEPVISHYTPEGHDIIQVKYHEFIKNHFSSVKQGKFSVIQSVFNFLSLWKRSSS